MLSWPWSLPEWHRSSRVFPQTCPISFSKAKRRKQRVPGIEVLLETAEDIDVVWSGGETTVTVRGDGRGGRNTEFALAAALELDRLENDDWVVASLATDGQDGNSESAGAIASRETIRRARELGIDPEAALDNNDSATFFRRIGGLVADRADRHQRQRSVCWSPQEFCVTLL